MYFDITNYSCIFTLNFANFVFVSCTLQMPCALQSCYLQYLLTCVPFQIWFLFIQKNYYIVLKRKTKLNSERLGPSSKYNRLICGFLVSKNGYSLYCLAFRYVSQLKIILCARLLTYCPRLLELILFQNSKFIRLAPLKCILIRFGDWF